jgi:hypothetical protein
VTAVLSFVLGVAGASSVAPAHVVLNAASASTTAVPARSSLPTSSAAVTEETPRTEPASVIPTTMRPTSTPKAASAPPASTVPAIVPRPVPASSTPPPPPTFPPPPWAASIRTTSSGYVTTKVGCAASTSATALDSFLRERIGPVLGWDYPHIYPLGNNRHLWLFQDAFIDQTGLASRLDQAAFVHNAALVQKGSCFTLYHRGTVRAPAAVESGPSSGGPGL